MFESFLNRNRARHALEVGDQRGKTQKKPTFAEGLLIQREPVKPERAFREVAPRAELKNLAGNLYENGKFKIKNDDDDQWDWGSFLKGLLFPLYALYYLFFYAGRLIKFLFVPTLVIGGGFLAIDRVIAPAVGNAAKEISNMPPIDFGEIFSQILQFLTRDNAWLAAHPNLLAAILIGLVLGFALKILIRIGH